METCSICYNENDVLLACRVCRKNGMCVDCEGRIEKCPFCRSRIRTVINIVPHQYHEVERIVDHRTFDGEDQFLILWTVGELTWEPAVTMLEDIPDLCEEYFQ